MKISDYRGEEALDLLADIIEPAAAIMADKEVAQISRSGGPVIKLIKPMIKNHKKEVIEILAVLDGEDPKEYAKKVNLFTLPKKLLDVVNDPDMRNLFSSQGQNAEETSSTSATGSIEGNAR